MVYGISAQGVTTIWQFVDALGLTFPIARDGGSQVYNQYHLSGGISPFPRDYIIDQRGIIRYVNTEYDFPAMQQIIDNLLGLNTDVDDAPAIIPDAVMLYQNQPNPFNPETVITFSIPRNEDLSQSVSLVVYSLLGQRIKTLWDAPIHAGQHQIRWNGQDESEQPVPSGVYIFQLTHGEQIETRKMTLLR